MTKRCATEHWRLRIIAAVILICCFGIQSANNQTRKSPRTNPAAQPSPQASPVASPSLTIDTSKVAAEVMQLNQRLRSLPDRLVSNESLAEIEQQVSDLRETTSAKAPDTELAIKSGAIFAELQQLLLDWRVLSKRVDGLVTVLNEQATPLADEVGSLKKDESRWLSINEEIKTQAASPELLELTSQVVADLSASIKLIEERRVRVVALQQSLAKQDSVIAGEVENIEKAMAQSQRSLLAADDLPLWKVQFGSQGGSDLGRLRGRSYAEDLSRLKAFIRAKRVALSVIVVLTFSVLVFFIRLSRGAKKGIGALNLEAQASNLYRPASASLLIFLVATTPLLYDAPVSAKAILSLLGVIPVMRLLQPRLTKPFRRMVVVLIAIVVLVQLTKFLHIPVWIKRDLLALFCLVIVASIGWLAHEARLDNLKQQQRHAPTIALIAIYVGILLLLLALVANVFGYTGLADLLSQATLLSAYRGVLCYTVFVVGSGLISFALQSKMTERLATLRAGGGRLTRYLTFLLGVILLLFWVISALNLFAIREVVYSAISVVLNYKITMGKASFAISNVVAFLLTLCFGFVLASVTRAVLGEEVLPRLKLARGLPNAIATVTHYVLLVLIFILALAAAGVELSQFAILSGAVGVGLGFGLQNVVNNFVSGLILLFERPVRVGDALEIRGVGGAVTKIGFRSCTLHAINGSDVIIPNAILVSEQVINWSLTGTLRQIILSIQVAYGNDPTTVRDLLFTTASSHPGVLKFPEPTAFFLGFGPYTLNFEVRFWAGRPEIVLELQSEVTLRIAAALKEAGIDMPAPFGNLPLLTTAGQSGASQTKAAAVVKNV